MAQYFVCKTPWYVEEGYWTCGDGSSQFYNFEIREESVLDASLTIAEAQTLFVPIALIFVGAYIWRKLRDVV